MRFSVLLPTHDGADVIEPAIRSVLAQTVSDFELLVVGDGCSDATAAVVSAIGDSRIHWFDLPKAPGFGYGNRNHALRRATGTSVAYMAHDDLWLPDHLELLARALDQPGVEIAYTQPLWVDVDGTLAPVDFDLADEATLVAFLAMERNAIPSVCVAHARECLERYGFWDESLPATGDWDLWRRIIAGGDRRRFAYLPVPSSLHFKAKWKLDSSLGPPELCVWRALHAIPGLLAAELRGPRSGDVSQQRAFWNLIRDSPVASTEALRAACAPALAAAASAMSPTPREDRPAFFFHPTTLLRRAACHHVAFREEQPFPHQVIDDFLPGDVADRLLREYPEPGAFQSETSSSEPRRRGKLRSRGVDDFTPFLRQVLEHFNSALCVDFLVRLSGIQRLVPDPDIGGALRHFGRGGRLGIHADFNFHPGLGLYRRLNLILYLNRDWRPEYRGDFELWDKGMSRCEKAIAPAFNRALLFAAGETAFHGFPRPLKCPRGVTRKSVQFYYYTKEPPPEGSAIAHGTKFRWRPDDALNPERWLHWARSRLHWG